MHLIFIPCIVKVTKVRGNLYSNTKKCCFNEVLKLSSLQITYLNVTVEKRHFVSPDGTEDSRYKVFLVILTAVYLVHAPKRVFNLVRVSLSLLECFTDVIIN
jgi:hypothetical protein